MTMIIKPAHFVVCGNCGKHGYILFSDETRSKEVYSQYEALDEAESALKEGRLVSVEVYPLVEQITESPLVNISDAYMEEGLGSAILLIMSTLTTGSSVAAREAELN